jgi:hypothetical protein
MYLHDWEKKALATRINMKCKKTIPEPTYNSNEAAHEKRNKDTDNSSCR